MIVVYRTSLHDSGHAVIVQGLLQGSNDSGLQNIFA
jgi:hypothetical protein